MTHDPKCRFAIAAECPVGIACDHGFDVCPICDPCDCGAVSAPVENIERQVQNGGKEKVSLLGAAKRKALSRKRAYPQAEELELAVAWFRGEIPNAAAAAAYEMEVHNWYGTAARILRDGVKAGMLKLSAVSAPAKPSETEH